MAKKILVMGLPGSGKSTLANKLSKKLDAEHFNADQVREMFNDWDFSEEGRIRQTQRMKILAEECTKQWAILDFICPKKELREELQADVVIWLDTIERGRYDDTNSMFERPDGNEYDICYDTLDSDKQAQEIALTLQGFDWKKPTVQMLGRWQPWHAGHRALFERCVAKTGQVAIQVRDVQGASGGEGQGDNPFDFEDVKANIIKDLSDKYTYGQEYTIMLVPNIVNITYGRGVGYVFEQEVFDDDVHSISATKIRAQMREEGRL